MGILLDRRKQQQRKQKEDYREWKWTDFTKWGGTNEEKHLTNNYAYKAPRSILKGNGAMALGEVGKEKSSSATMLDLNNNNLASFKTKDEGEGNNMNGKSAKKGLRWKVDAEDDEETCHPQEWRNSFVDYNNMGGEVTLNCCTVCGGRIWAGDKKSTIFGNDEQKGATNCGGGNELLVHWACFRCATCGLDLGDEQQEKVFKKNGRFYCQMHGPVANTLAEKQLKCGTKGEGGMGKCQNIGAAKNTKQMPPIQIEHPPSTRINRRQEWWEKSADEFNGNKKSSTIIRYYGEGNTKMVANLYSPKNLVEAEKQQQQKKMTELTETIGEKSKLRNEIMEEIGKYSNERRKMNENENKTKKFTTTNKIVKQRGNGSSAALKDDDVVDFCEHCGIELSNGSLVLAKGRAWCPEHFCCANSACARSLLESGFVEDPTQPNRNYCPKCYEMLIAPVCHKCSLPLTESCLNALSQKWHPDCFCCAHCLKPFGTRSFFVENGKPYCENDWNQLFTEKCAECLEPIKVGQKWLEALGGRSFHAGCFKCTTCRITLEGKTFFEREQRPYCRAHACQQQTRK